MSIIFYVMPYFLSSTSKCTLLTEIFLSLNSENYGKWSGYENSPNRYGIIPLPVLMEKVITFKLARECMAISIMVVQMVQYSSLKYFHSASYFFAQDLHIFIQQVIFLLNIYMFPFKTVNFHSSLQIFIHHSKFPFKFLIFLLTVTYFHAGAVSFFHSATILIWSVNFKNKQRGFRVIINSGLLIISSVNTSYERL